MNNDEDDKEKELPKKADLKSDKEKEKILDESFKKAELLRNFLSKKKEKEDTVIKKPFIKIGSIIAIIAVIGFVFINLIPWMYINCDTDYGSIEEYFSYKDFRNNQIDSTEIKSLFESTCNNCSDNSRNYIGITINDFINIPRMTSYIFVIQAAIGVIFTIFILIDRKIGFSEETVIIIHSIFVASLIIIGIMLILFSINFLGAHLLLELNKPFIEVLGLYNIKLFFFMPYVLFMFSIGLFILGLAFVRINLNKAVNKLELDKSKESDLIYKFGSNI